MPFPVCFCPTPAQRALYVAATRYTDSQLMSKYTSHRVSTAWDEYFYLATEALKSAAMSASSSYTPPVLEPVPVTRDEVVNTARHELRSTCCLICMDESPSVSTLCCGQPVHLTCLSNWLTQRRNSHAAVDCPHCRSDMSEPGIGLIDTVPILEPDVSVAETDETSSNFSATTDTTFVESDNESESTSTVVDDDDDDDSADTTTTSIVPVLNDETVTIVADDNDNDSDSESDVSDDSNDTTTTTSLVIDEGTSTTSVHVPIARPQCSISNCHNISAGECPNTRCARCCAKYEGIECHRHGTHINTSLEYSSDDSSSTTSY
jgi:hypothetical protein